MSKVLSAGIQEFSIKRNAPMPLQPSNNKNEILKYIPFECQCQYVGLFAGMGESERSIGAKKWKCEYWTLGKSSGMVVLA